MDSDNLFGKQRAKKKFKAQGMTNKQARKAANAVRKDNAKKTVKKVGTAVKKAAQKVVRTIGNVALTPVLPFKAAMKKILQKKGVNTSKMDNIAVIEKFYNTVVAKDKSSGYESYEECFLTNHPLMRVPATSENYERMDEFDPATITLVVTAIVNYFKKAKKKKQDSANPSIELSEDDKIAADQMDKVEKDLNEKELQANGVTNGQLSKYVKYIAIAVALAFAVWFFFIRKK